MNNLKRPGAVFAAAFTTALVIILASCPGTGPGAGDNPYDGTVWENAGATISFETDTEWQMAVAGSAALKGTYTYSESESSITITSTHFIQTQGGGWTAVTAESAPEFAGPQTGKVEGNTYTLNGTIYFKQGAGNGSPHYGTVWEDAKKTTLSFVSGTEWQRTGSGKTLKGTYTYSGDNIKFTPVEERADSGAAWTPAADEPFQGIVLRNCLVLIDGSVFTKLPITGNSPYYGTSWRASTPQGTITCSFMFHEDWLMIPSDGGVQKGTYTFTDDTIDFTLTDISEDFGAAWETKDGSLKGTVADSELTINTLVFTKMQ